MERSQGQLPLSSLQPTPRSSNLRSATATASDFTLAVVLSVLTASRLGPWCGERAVLALAIDEPGSWWRGPLPLVLGILGSVVYSLPFTMIAVGIARLAFGRSPGQTMWNFNATPLPAPPLRRLAQWSDEYAVPLLLALALIVGRLRFTELSLALIGIWTLRRIVRHWRG